MPYHPTMGRYARIRAPLSPSHQKAGEDSGSTFLSGRVKANESIPAAAKISGKPAVCPNESACHATVTVWPKRSLKYRCPSVNWRASVFHAC